MPHLIWSDDAIRDVGRLRRFLSPKNPAAAARAAGTIRRAVRILADHPGVGRTVENLPKRFRELVIPFGDGGYLARYELAGEAVVIVRVRHQSEAGYGEPRSGLLPHNPWPTALLNLT